ncbi:MAG: MMPL family transporter [Pseudomonadota bacterium]
MVERLLTANLRGRLWGLAVILALSALAWSQLPKLYIDRSDERLIRDDHPGWDAFNAMTENFGGEESVLIYLRADDLWTAERLKQIQDLGFAIEDLPEVTSVTTLLSSTNIRDKGDYVDAGPLIDVVQPTKIAEAREDAFYSPLMRRAVISDDGLSTSISLSYERPPGDPAFELKMYQTLEDLVTPLRADFDAIFQLGAPRLQHEIGTGLRTDLKTLIPTAIVVLLVIITAFLRSVRALPIPLVTSAISLLWTLGFMAAFGLPLTLLTAIVPALIIVIGSVEDVHLLAAYLHGISEQENPNRATAIQIMAKRVGLPIVITAITTTIGFGANIVTEIPLIKEFAVVSAFAMFANLVVTVLAVPIMLHWFGPTKTGLIKEGKPPSGLIGLIVRCIEYLSENFPGWIIGTTALVLVVFSTAIDDIRVNSDPLSYFQPDHPFVVDAGTMHEELSGLQLFSVTLHASQEDFFKTPQGLREIAEFQKFLNKQGIYDKTSSFADMMSIMNQEFHQGDRLFHYPPENQDDADLYVATFTRDQMEPFVTEDFSTARIMVRHNVTNSIALNDALDEVRSAAPDLLNPGIAFELTGKNLMINGAAQSLVSGQFASLLLIVAIVFLLFSALYTSYLAGALSLVPNLIPVLLNFGLMGFLGIPLNPGTAMVAAVAIGIAVDDTVHLMTRFGAESRLNLDERDAVRQTIRDEAIPIISTSFALAIGFGVLFFSDFSIVAQFGLLAAATMLYAVISDLLIMPILLKNLRLATVWDIVALQLDREVLVNCPLFKNMSTYAIKKVVLISQMQNFEAGEEIIEQGTTSTGMYVVLDGKADVKVKRDDIVLDIDSMAPGAVFGEIGFSGEGVERTATIVATEPVTVVRMEADITRKALRFYPQIAARLHQNISNLLAERLIESHTRLAESVRMYLS